MSSHDWAFTGFFYSMTGQDVGGMRNLAWSSPQVPDFTGSLIAEPYVGPIQNIRVTHWHSAWRCGRCGLGVSVSKSHEAPGDTTAPELDCNSFLIRSVLES